MTAESGKRGDVAPDGRRDNDITLQQIWRALQQGRWLVGFAIAVGTGGGWISGQALGPTNRRITLVDNKAMLIDSLSRIVRMNEALFDSGSETSQCRCAGGFSVDAFFADHSALPRIHRVVRNHLAASLSLDNFVENLLCVEHAGDLET